MSQPAEYESMIRRCFALAEASVEQGNHPFGALLYRDGEIVAQAENTVLSGSDVTGHAEMNLVRQVSARYEAKRLADAILFTSAEPCVMCCGAIFWSGIGRVVFGVSAPALAVLTGGHFVIESREIFAQLTPRVGVDGPILESEGLEIHRRFW
jgi:tRNA(Arg) A34 adenosine deaminase TadA